MTQEWTQANAFQYGSFMVLLQDTFVKSGFHYKTI